MEEDTLDLIDTIDTRVDHVAITDDVQEGLDTVRETPLDSLELDPVTLATIHGSMKWESFRRSTNIEDRRTPAAKQRDQEWWDRNR